MRYTVTCQDAIGHRAQIVVHATTDEGACNTALRTLNTWRALNALPTRQAPQTPPPLEQADEPPVEQAVHPDHHNGRIIHRPSVTELIHERRGGRLGALGQALKRAAGEGGQEV